MNRIGIWYYDGSIMTFAARMGNKTRTLKEIMAEALDVLDDANKGVKDTKKLAKLVEFDLPDDAMKEIV